MKYEINLINLNLPAAVPDAASLEKLNNLQFGCWKQPLLTPKGKGGLGADTDGQTQRRLRRPIFITK